MYSVKGTLFLSIKSRITLFIHQDTKLITSGFLYYLTEPQLPQRSFTNSASNTCVSSNIFLFVPVFPLNSQSILSCTQFSSVTQSCLTLWDPMDCSTPGLPVHHQLPEPTQTHVHWVGDAIQPSHPLSSPSPPTFNPSQHQDLFQWVSSSHQVAKVLEFQLQHEPFQWIFRIDIL